MDTTVINQSVNLVSLVPGLRKQGQYHIGPCPFCGGEDRFNIKHTDDGDLWICRRCGDGRYHDAIAFLMRRDGLSFMEVAGGNAAAGHRALPAAAPAVPEPKPVAGPPDEEWQITTLVALKDCLDYLHQGDTRDAAAIWRYLQQKRGLSKETIFRASLGFNPAWREVAPGRWLAPGVVIPCMVDGELWYVTVRTTQAAREAAKKRGRTLGKYHLLSGSRLGTLYNANAVHQALCYTTADSLYPGVPRPAPTLPVVVVVEGEFDALLLGQHLPGGWAAVTMGGAGNLPGPEALSYLSVAVRVLVHLDDDDAGRRALQGWRRLLPNVAPLGPLPDGAKDITDYHQNGGDIVSWITSKTQSNR